MGCWIGTIGPNWQKDVLSMITHTESIINTAHIVTIYITMRPKVETNGAMISQCNYVFVI